MFQAPPLAYSYLTSMYDSHVPWRMALPPKSIEVGSQASSGVTPPPTHTLHLLLNKESSNLAVKHPPPPRTEEASSCQFRSPTVAGGFGSPDTPSRPVPSSDASVRGGAYLDLALGHAQGVGEAGSLRSGQVFGLLEGFFQGENLLA